MFCSLFEKKKMDQNYNRGDLTDVIRAASAGVSSSEFSFDSSSGQTQSDHDQHPWDLSCFDFLSGGERSRSVNNNFGDPFSSALDPLFFGAAGSGSNNLNLVCSWNSPELLSIGVGARGWPSDDSEAVVGMGNENNNYCEKEKIITSSSRRRRRVREVGGGGASATATATASSSDMVSTMSRSSLYISSEIQISSPRNPAAIKRRKSQVKKVVCIPAPTPANNSRPSSGEVVPSDLWAWRKYGQKPIKGSPFPRGYYRCSSSKGCPARKQVERSRNDPNMLVITYTSDHNHPWPTQRNALAGSTRSHSSRNIIKTAADPDPEADTATAPPPSSSSSILRQMRITNADDVNTMELVVEDEGDIPYDDLITSPPALLVADDQSDDFFAEFEVGDTTMTTTTTTTGLLDPLISDLIYDWPESENNNNIPPNSI